MTSRSDLVANVVITGASGGIGSAVVRALSRRANVNVLATDKDRYRLDELVLGLEDAEGEIIPFVVDATRPGALQEVVEAAVARWGALHGIANIAGYTPPPQPITETSDATYDTVMDVNAKTAFAGTRAALPHLAQTHGAVVNVGSYFAIRGGTSFATYIAAKHAVVGLSKAAAWEAAPMGVRVNVVSPGPTYTDMVLAAYDAINAEDREEGKRIMESRSPSGRLSYPEEVAETIVWALLDAPEHLTGQVISVDGGKAS